MFQIDLKSRKSIYEQVMIKMKELIITGVLPAESRIPSVRELSRKLTVNPNTVQKAYRELERQGYIYTVSGRGCFVSEKQDIPADSERAGQLLREIEERIRELLYLGFPEEDIRNRLQAVFGKEEKRA